MEKDALVDVMGTACNPYQVDFFSCRGYASDSELFNAAQRLRRQVTHGEKAVTALHLGDHDPSGCDMTRDIAERLHLYSDGYVPRRAVKRIALNMDQVEEYQPPENPAKITDSRAGAYIAEHGGSSWELDALEPQVLVDLVTHHIEDCVADPDAMQALKDKAQRQRDAMIEAVAGMEVDDE